MMKKLILLLVSLSCITAWSQKPDWVKAHPEGRSVFVQGILVDNADSLVNLPGSITIINTEEGNQTYSIKANSMGIFQFHLVENSKYVATFEYPDYIVKKIAFDTFNVPDKVWKLGAMIDLKVSLDKRPDGFKDVVAMLPVATFQYDPAERLFLFDMEVTDRVMRRYQAELDRARGVTVESNEDAPVQEDATKD
jgi:hypothetical protein